MWCCVHHDGRVAYETTHCKFTEPYEEWMFSVCVVSGVLDVFFEEIYQKKKKTIWFKARPAGVYSWHELKLHYFHFMYSYNFNVINVDAKWLDYLFISRENHEENIRFSSSVLEAISVSDIRFRFYLVSVFCFYASKCFPFS